jgi:hypothetical protein
VSRSRKALGKGLEDLRSESIAGRHPVDDLDAFLAAHPHVKVKTDFGAVDMRICGDVKPETLKALGAAAVEAAKIEREYAPAKEYPKGYLPSEDDEQIAFAQYLEFRRIPFYAVPNGGKRVKRKNKKGEWYSPEAQKLKAMGVQAGVPDVVIVVARGGFHGFYLELKRREKWKIDDKQIEWAKTLTREGYWHQYAYGCEDAIRKTEHYLNLPKREL